MMPKIYESLVKKEECDKPLAECGRQGYAIVNYIMEIMEIYSVLILKQN